MSLVFKSCICGFCLTFLLVDIAYIIVYVIIYFSLHLIVFECTCIYVHNAGLNSHQFMHFAAQFVSISYSIHVYEFSSVFNHLYEGILAPRHLNKFSRDPLSHKSSSENNAFIT